MQAFRLHHNFKIDIPRFEQGKRASHLRDNGEGARPLGAGTPAGSDAACEGLNLQTLGTLINVDLPWNPSRLEQRIGRIKRLGQRRDRVDMLNLLYHGSTQPTVDEKVYAKLSSRMKDRFDIFGTLPDVIDDDWIDDEERLEDELKNYTNRRARANAFDLRYAGDVVPKDERWELCVKVLARNNVTTRLSRGWGERSQKDD
jgi:superfamily II DNA/RNA helicase